IAGGKGAININVLWEMGGAQRVLHGVLERTKGLVAGVTCGAGMPYKLSEIAASYGVNYLPIVSSGRAFNALWKRAYSKAAERLDRQSGAGRDRLPVRHAPAADAGKPDFRAVEGTADAARRGRRAAAPLLADRLLFVGGAHALPAQPRSALRTPDRLQPRGGG